MYFAVSDSGYSKHEIGVQWLEHFDEYTWKKRKRAWRMPIMDGASYHTNEKFVRVCYSKNISTFRLPLHTTRLLQPLDVVCFQPLNHYHSETIDEAVRDGDCEYSKIRFLARITSIRSQTFKKKTVQESFRKTGLIPFNPKIVMQKLRDLSPPSAKPDLPPASLTPVMVDSRHPNTSVTTTKVDQLIPITTQASVTTQDRRLGLGITSSPDGPH